MSLPMGPQELHAYIVAQGIAAELIGGLGDTPTVPAAAAALGVTPDQIIKTLLFLIDRPDAGPQPLVVISYGERRVDKGLLAARWEVAKKRVNLAPAAVVLDLLGFAAGGVPPFGHRTALPVVIDAGILTARALHGGVIYGGGGDDRTMMKLTVNELLRVTGGEVLRLNPDA